MQSAREQANPLLPLQGIRVLDLSRVLAGPFCAALLGDMGAEVIKIEDTNGGDETRTWPPRKGIDSAAYLVCNRNKRGMTLNLGTEAGQKIFRRLVRNSDVVVENFRTGAMEKFGLGYEDLSQLNPGLVYCSISAFGRTGPLADAAGYEALLQAFGGVMSLTGEPGGDPVRCGLSFIDLSTGIMAAFAIVNALFLRTKTGKGQRVECSLLQTDISLLNYHAQAYLLDGTVAKPLGSSHPSLAPYRNFRCRDGKFVFVAAANDRFWARLCKALGLEHLVEDPRYKTNVERVRHREEADRIVADAVARYDSEDVLRLMDEAGVPAAPVNTIDRALREPQVEHLQMVQQVEHSRLGPIQVIGVPITASGKSLSIRKAAPTYGEHTAEILRELGYNEADIAALRAQAVIV